MLSILLEGYFWYFFGMTSCIVSESHLVDILILFIMSRWPQSFFVNFIVLQIDLILYLNLFWLMWYFYLWCHIDISRFRALHNFTNWFNLFYMQAYK